MSMLVDVRSGVEALIGWLAEKHEERECDGVSLKGQDREIDFQEGKGKIIYISEKWGVGEFRRLGPLGVMLRGRIYVLGRGRGRGKGESVFRKKEGRGRRRSVSTRGWGRGIVSPARPSHVERGSGELPIVQLFCTATKTGWSRNAITRCGFHNNVAL